MQQSNIETGLNGTFFIARGSQEINDRPLVQNFPFAPVGLRGIELYPIITQRVIARLKHEGLWRPRHFSAF
jgi:hypothetical protein